MAVLESKPGAGSCIISEGDHGFSRDTVSVAVPGEGTYDANTVLGRVTADGTYVEYDPTANDGSETVAGILIYPAKGTTDKVVLRRHAQVKASDLVWFEGASAGQITTGHAELEALGIIVR